MTKFLESEDDLIDDSINEKVMNMKVAEKFHVINT